jgi:hypothetical protein
VHVERKGRDDTNIISVSQTEERLVDLAADGYYTFISGSVATVIGLLMVNKLQKVWKSATFISLEAVSQPSCSMGPEENHEASIAVVRR